MANINALLNSFLMMILCLSLSACTGSDSGNKNYIPENISRPNTDLNTVATFENGSNAPVNSAVAEILEDGSVITWGLRDFGGYSGDVKSDLYNIKDIIPLIGGFIAVRTDGTMIPWGKSLANALARTSIKDNLYGITEYYSNNSGSFIFYRDADETAIIEDNIYDSSYVVATDVREIFTNISHNQYGVIYNDGSVDTWDGSGQDTSALVDIKLYDIDTVTATGSAWAALRGDMKVIAWGDITFGGNTNIYYSYLNSNIPLYGTSNFIGDQLYNIVTVRANYGSFSALRSDGNVITWGHKSYGAGGYVMGNSPSSPVVIRDVSAQLVNVASIYSNNIAFSALKNDGSVVSWGLSGYGGDSSDVQSELYNIVSIEAYEDATTGKIGFKATRSDEQTFIW